MVAPPWPEHPILAAPAGDAWYVKGFPPAPYPFQVNPPFDHAKFGPAGTRWVWTGGDVLDAITHVPETQLFLRIAMQDLYNKLCLDKPSTQLFAWQVPADDGAPNDPLEYGMRWIHATINAKLGDVETITHTMNFRTAPTADADQDQAAISTFAGQLRDIWATWMAAEIGTTGKTPASFLSTSVQYQDVTAAYLEQTAGATLGTRPSHKSAGLVRTFAYPRPTYLVDTQYAPFTPAVGGTNNQPQLPNEVACCVSMQTGLRGPRNRGRLYLGGLTADLMASGGVFDATKVGQISTAMADLVHRINTGTGARLHVVSRAYATSVGINGVSVGQVPDSQRRRRRSQLENYGTVVST